VPHSLFWTVVGVLAFSFAFYLAASAGRTIEAVVIAVFGLPQVLILGAALYLWRRGSVE
jgi:hypothetical protein